MRPSPLRIVLLGCRDPAEFPWVAAALSLLPRSATVKRVAALTDDWPVRAAQADLCVVFQSWPDEIPARTAHVLIAACAAGRLICCQGVWCASDGRTRGIWPPAVCVPIENLSSRMAYELGVLSGERPPLPATASRDEAFAAHYAQRPENNSVSAVIDSPDTTYARELQRALNCSPPAVAPECLIIDADRTGDGASRCDVSDDDAARVAVAGFPRPEQIGARRVAGVRTTISKLAPLSELRAAVDRAVAIGRSES